MEGIDTKKVQTKTDTHGSHLLKKFDQKIAADRDHFYGRLPIARYFGPSQKFSGDLLPKGKGNLGKEELFTIFINDGDEFYILDEPITIPGEIELFRKVLTTTAPFVLGYLPESNLIMLPYDHTEGREVEHKLDHAIDSYRKLNDPSEDDAFEAAIHLQSMDVDELKGGYKKSKKRKTRRRKNKKGKKSRKKNKSKRKI